MKIAQLMSTDIAACGPETNLAVIAKLMWDHDCGFVPIVDTGRKVVGVITDRDICIASATRRLLPEQITAAHAMRRSPIHTCLPDDAVEKALAAMKEFRIRRLPVVAADGALQGVLSMNDVVLASETKAGPPATDVTATLAAICAHKPGRAAAA